jgi:RIO-like serine/threonine protein kinase
MELGEIIAERKTKTVYKIDGKTVKLFVENYSKASILNEALNQARVEEGTNLNIPKLLGVTQINNRWALVSEHIEGTTLEELMNQNPEKMDEYLNRFVDIQLEVLENSVPMLNPMKEKYKKRINSADNIDYNTKYELLQRLDGMKTHTKLCHGDFNPSNIIIKEDNSAYIIDWAHVTAGNASSDSANTFLLFSLDGKEDIAEKYLDLFAQKSGIEKKYIQKWIPIVAAARKASGKTEEQDFLDKWIDVVDYQ